MPSKRTRAHEILEELLSNPEPERPLRGHEVIRMVYAGHIPPGQYRYESETMDGMRKIETFEADEEGRVRNLKMWVEEPKSAESKPKKRGERSHGSRPASAANRRSKKNDQ